MGEHCFYWLPYLVFMKKNELFDLAVGEQSAYDMDRPDQGDQGKRQFSKPCPPRGRTPPSIRATAPP